ncbi:MAG: NADH-quinone oxidoreductase subunit NuoF [Deltaproteobacteria bacterium]|nr:NADH-quinone oxidoreductase subunit NuoF [Deltaproteobacteria bacterium]
MLEIRTPESAALSQEQVAGITDICQRFRRIKGGLLPALHQVQFLCGNWLPLEALQQVAREMGVPYPYLYGVLSFYTMFATSPRGKHLIRMCESPPCHVNGAENMLKVLKQELGVDVGETTADGLFTLELTACIGVCEVAPAMQINEVVHGRLTAERVKAILDDYRAGKAPDYKELRRTTNPVSDYPASPDELSLLRNVDVIDPMSLDDYLAKGGYEALKKALTTMTGEEVVNVVKDSGLRGRGGAGFPTGLKWSFTRPSPIFPKYMICNADEGEPGTIKDRYIMEGDPHRVLEGMAIAGYAIGAHLGYIYCRGEYYLSMHRLQHAIDQAMAKGYLGDNIFGTDFSFHVQIQTGGGSYVCGEETALIESIQGQRGYPRVKPPFPGQVGVWYKPTIVNNVESYSSVPDIIIHGADWYKAKGTEDSKGTKIYQVVGQVNRPGVVECNMGRPLSWLINDIGGGVREGRKLKAVQPGGAASGFILPEHADTPLEYKALYEVEGALGSGTMLVMDDTTCIVDVVKCLMYFFQHESCGFCLPCRRGTRVLYELVCKVINGNGSEADLDRMVSLSKIMTESTNCALGWSPHSFLKTTIERFRKEWLDHVHGKCALGVCSKKAHAAAH